LADAVNVIKSNLGSKPVYGLIGPLCASAGYWLAAALPELRANSDSMVGSIGVRMMDYSVFRAWKEFGVDIDEVHFGARKIDGSPMSPLTQERHDAFQSMVDEYGIMFVNHIAQSRGVTPEAVRAEFGDGMVYSGTAAKARGMIDAIVPMFGGAVTTQASTEKPQTKAMPSKEYFLSAFESLAASAVSSATSVATQATIAASIGSAAIGPITLAANPAILENTTMAISARVKSALFATGFTNQINASDEICESALTAFYKAKGAAVPTEEATILSDVSSTLVTKVAVTAAEPIAAPGKVKMTADEYRERRTALQSIAGLVNSGRSTALITDTMVQEALDADDARKPLDAIQSEWAAKVSAGMGGTPSVSIVQTGSGQDLFAADAVQAVVSMATNGRIGKPNNLTGLSGVQLAQLSLQTAGVNLPQFATAEEVAEQALGMGQAIDSANRRTITGRNGIGASGPVNRPADFPNVMAQAVRLIMEDAAALAPTTFEQWADRLPDADTMDITSLGGAGVIDDLDDHVDGRDVKERKMSEEHKGWIQVQHQANDIALTPLMVVDAIKFQGFLRMIRDLTQAGKRSLNRKLIALLGGNPQLIDGIVLFHTSHGNLVASGAAPSDTALRANRALHSAQKPPGATAISGVDPTIVLVPDALKITAQIAFQTLLQVNGMAVANVESSQAFFKDRIKVLSDPELDNYSASAWYSLVDPTLTELRSFVYRYKAGYGDTGRATEYMDPKKRARVYGIDFIAGCGISKHRGVVKNPG
jgi:hypothetical protein